MTEPPKMFGHRIPRLAFVGFGEASMALTRGLRSERPDLRVTAYDVKTASPCTAIQHRKFDDYRAAAVDGASEISVALADADVIICAVTADQALVAATEAATVLPVGAFYLDINSCAPSTKTQSAAVIDDAGGRYVDVAVMAPVLPKLHRTPMLVAGPHAKSALSILDTLGMAAVHAGDDIGAAAAIKMTRSIMVKGLEALMIECVLAGTKAGVSEAVFTSLEESFPGFGWRDKAAYMLERAITHGIRRASELHEVATMLDEFGVGSTMSRATAAREQEVGELRLLAEKLDDKDYSELATLILAAPGWRAARTGNADVD